MLPQDVLHDLDAASEIRVPFSFNNLVKYYNKKQFIEENFKTSVQIPVNWNKRNIILSWLMIHSWNTLSDDRSRQILMQTVNNSILQCRLMSEMRYPKTIRQGLLEAFMASVILKHCNQSEGAKLQRKNKADKDIELEAWLATAATGVLEDEKADFYTNNEEQYETVAYDYVRMCRQRRNKKVRGKVSLDIKSFAQLSNRHNAFQSQHDYYIQHTKDVTIPKDSKFAALRKLLPDDFEWITDRKRLILETELQHHCVWSYADFITKDKCAIYSYVDKSEQFNNEPKRYTIEFRWDNTNKEYYVVQVQGRYNRVNANNMKEYIQVLLDGYQSKKEAV